MLSPSKKDTVLQLFSQGKNYWQIKNKTNFKLVNIKTILRVSIGAIFTKALDTLKITEFYYLEEQFITFFNELYDRISVPYNRFRNYCRFFPPCLYIFFKLKGISVTFSDLTYLETKKEIRSGFKILVKFYPEYYRRDKKQITLLKIARTIETFQLDQAFTNVSTRLLTLLWNQLSSAGESTVAASICLLTNILLGKTHPSHAEMCKFLRVSISMPYIHLRKLKINNIDFNTLDGLKASSSQIRKLFYKDKILNQFIEFGLYYYACTSCHSLNEGIKFQHQKMTLKCHQCGSSFPKCIKSKRNPELVNFWTGYYFHSILQVLKNLCELVQKSQNTLTDNDLQLVYGLRKHITLNFGIYKNMKTLISKDFSWTQEAKKRIETIIAHTSSSYRKNQIGLPNFDSINRDFIYNKSNYFFIKIQNSALEDDHIKYRYLKSSGKTFIIFQFDKLFKLQEAKKVCPRCHKPYLKRYRACPDCVFGNQTPKASKLRKSKAKLTSNMSVEIRHLKKIIRDLTYDENKKLLEKSKLKIIGFSPQEFYKNYVYGPKGIKPVIEWSDNKLLNKTMFQHTLSKLEKQNNLIKLFYNTREWNIRKPEILERDKDKCSICSRPSNVVHHRLSATYNPEICLDPKNLITICRRCHKQINED